MNLDEPVVFYLKHQQQIEEWYQLRKYANKAALQFLESLAHLTEERANQLGHDVYCVSMLDIGYPKIFLCKTHWCDKDPSTLHEQEDIMKIRVALGLEWTRNTVQLSSDDSMRTLYSGVWFHPEHPTYSSLEPEVRKRVGVPKGAAKNRWWAFYRYEPFNGEEVWNHLDEYRDQLLDRIFELWQKYEGKVDEAVRNESATIESKQ